VSIVGMPTSPLASIAAATPIIEEVVVELKRRPSEWKRAIAKETQERQRLASPTKAQDETLDSSDDDK
jgi:hypothetical protein